MSKCQTDPAEMQRGDVPLFYLCTFNFSSPIYSISLKIKLPLVAWGVVLSKK